VCVCVCVRGACPEHRREFQLVYNKRIIYLTCLFYSYGGPDCLYGTVADNGTIYHILDDT
jgi:hypothetical protein